MQKSKQSPTPGGKANRIVYSTTDGRQRFPDILQVSYGEKAVIGFDRYGRALGAVVPMEAVLMLAGKTQDVDDDVKLRIERAAQKLLQEVSRDDAVDLDDLDAERSRQTVDLSADPAKRRKAAG
jgi:hypothetical protein